MNFFLKKLDITENLTQAAGALSYLVQILTKSGQEIDLKSNYDTFAGGKSSKNSEKDGAETDRNLPLSDPRTLDYTISEARKTKRTEDDKENNYMSFDKKDPSELNFKSKDTYLSDEIDGDGISFFGYGKIKSGATSACYVDYDDLQRLEFSKKNSPKNTKSDVFFETPEIKKIVKNEENVEKVSDFDDKDVKSQITEKTLIKKIGAKDAEMETPSMRTINVTKTTEKKENQSFEDKLISKSKSERKLIGNLSDRYGKEARKSADDVDKTKLKLEKKELRRSFFEKVFKKKKGKSQSPRKKNKSKSPKKSRKSKSPKKASGNNKSLNLFEQAKIINSRKVSFF